MSALFSLLQKIRSGRKVLGLGLMSGTSADGTDLALLEFSQKTKPKLLCAKTYSFSPRLRRKILALQQARQISPEEWILTSQFLGEFWAGEIRKFLRMAKRVRPDFIASHGQTVRHIPVFQNLLGRSLRGSGQWGEADILAKRLNTIVVSDFRAGDVALGGSGAPLMPFVHKFLFSSPNGVRGVLNIGGIANLTFLGRKNFSATDTGPGNCWADYLAQKFYRTSHDAGGKKALTGKVSPALLAALKKNSFFARPFPKSTGKEDFSVVWLERALRSFRSLPREDVLASVEAVTAWGVVEAIRRNAAEKLNELYLAGGGAKNLFFIKQLQNYLPGVSFYLTDRLGYPADFLEAVGFAVLGWWCLRGEKVGAASVTGAKKKGVLGKISQV